MEKILVIQTAFIGDAILTLPMIQKLKEFFPDSSVDIIATPVTFEIFSNSTYINNVIILDKREKHKKLKSFLKFCSNLKNMNYTRVYSPHRSFRSSLIVYFSGIKNSFGFDKNSLRFIYKNLIKYNDRVHEVQRNLTLVGADVSEDKWKVLPIISTGENVKKNINNFFSNIYSNNFIAVAPGSIWETKKYPVNHFREIISSLTKENYFILLLGGKSDQALCENIAAESGNNVISVAGIFSLTESVEVLKRCRLLVSNDSAPAHLGLCAGIPVLMLYCSTVPGFGFYPYSSGSDFLSYDNLFCKPCGIHGYKECPVKSFDCGNKLLPSEVINKIKGMLNGN